MGNLLSSQQHGAQGGGTPYQRQISFTQPGAVAPPLQLSTDQMRTLLRNGLRRDIALVPFQMPRMSDRDTLPPSKPRPAITLKNEVNLHRKSLIAIHDDSSLSLKFTFDALCPCTITVYYMYAEASRDNLQTVVHSTSPPPYVYHFSAGMNQTFQQSSSDALLISKYTSSQLIYDPTKEKVTEPGQLKHYPFIVVAQSGGESKSKNVHEEKKRKKCRCKQN